MKISAVGIAWYHEADYGRLLEIFEDGKTLHATYDDWLKDANGLIERIKNAGVIVEKAYITPEEFLSWCAARGLRLNSDARKTFANEFAARKYRDQD